MDRPSEKKGMARLRLFAWALLAIVMVMIVTDATLGMCGWCDTTTYPPRSPCVDRRRCRSIILQSAGEDGRYAAMLKTTSGRNRRYAMLRGYDYRSEVVRFHPHDYAGHLSKAFLIDTILKENRHDYILYMDADAVVQNASFRIEDLVDTKRTALHMCQGGRHFAWNVNAGVILVDATQSAAGPIVCHWKCRMSRAFDVWIFLSTSLGLDPASVWFSDQVHLQRTLFTRSDSISNLKWPGQCVINYNGSFVAHHLRSCSQNMSERLRRVRKSHGGCPPSWYTS